MKSDIMTTGEVLEWIFDESYYLFPFAEVPVNSSIIIYGIGKTGKEYVRQIMSTNYCNISFLTDRNWTEKTTEYPIPICSPDRCIHENGYVVIAIADRTVAEEAIEELNELGVEMNRIIRRIIRVPFVLSKEQCHAIANYKYTASKVIDKPTLKYLTKLKSKLKVFSVADNNKIRVGSLHDGGYVMVKDFVEDSGVAYSFGIANDVSWDEAMVEKGYDVYMYDHTINDLPYYRNGFHFYKKGIACDIKHGSDVGLLEEIITENHHENKKGMILKLDVEGAEYGAIINTPIERLMQFDQIVMEVHDLVTNTNHDSVLSAFDKLNQAFELVHIHANNYGSVLWIDGSPFPDVLELTYLNKNSQHATGIEEKQSFPMTLDSANWKDWPDVKLGNWNQGTTVS